DARCIIGTRANRREIPAQNGFDARADRFCLTRIAARLFFDDAFEHALHKGDSRCLDRLEVARRKQAWPIRNKIVATVCEKCPDISDNPSAPSRAKLRYGVFTFEPGADC